MTNDVHAGGAAFSERSPGEVHVHISILDRPEDFKPQIHVFHEKKIDWLDLDDGLRRYATLPRDRD